MPRVNDVIILGLRRPTYPTDETERTPRHLRFALRARGPGEARKSRSWRVGVLRPRYAEGTIPTNRKETTMSALPPRRPRLNTVREVCLDYLNRDAAVSIENEFSRERRRIILMFIAACGDITMDDLIADDLEKFVENNQGWRSSHTRLNGARIVKRALNWAWNKGLIDNNPLRGVTYPRGERFKPMRVEDFRILLRDTTAEFRRVLLFLWWTGARPNELRSEKATSG